MPNIAVSVLFICLLTFVYIVGTSPSGQLCNIHFVVFSFYSAVSWIDNPKAFASKEKFDNRMSSPFSIREMYGLFFPTFFSPNFLDSCAIPFFGFL